MKSISLQEICTEVYNYFYEKIYKQQLPYKSQVEKKQIQAVENFCAFCNEKYGDSVGAVFVWNYCTFQFNRFSLAIQQDSLKVPGGKVTLQLLFSKKAIESFEQRDVKFDFTFIDNRFTSLYKISKSEFSFKTHIQFVEKIESFHSFHNPVKASVVRSETDVETMIATCRDLTDLYDEFDRSCQKCKAQIKCKQLTQQIYPKP